MLSKDNTRRPPRGLGAYQRVYRVLDRDPALTRKLGPLVTVHRNGVSGQFPNLVVKVAAALEAKGFKDVFRLRRDQILGPAASISGIVGVLDGSKSEANHQKAKPQVGSVVPVASASSKPGLPLQQAENHGLELAQSNEEWKEPKS